MKGVWHSLQTQITKEDLWIRTYGRLYQKLCSTTCEIPIGIYRTQDSQSAEEGDYYEENAGTETPMSMDSAGGAKRSSGPDFTASADKYGSNNYYRCFRGACVGSESSFTSQALTVNDEPRGDPDSHAQLIERAEIANMVRSRMQSLGLPIDDETDLQFSEKRNSLSYVIINPSCDLRLKEGDVIYLIRPSPFSATKTFERHNSRRKSTLNPTGASAGKANTHHGADELQKAALTLFHEGKRGNHVGARVDTQSGPTSNLRRRSSSGTEVLRKMRIQALSLNDD